MAFVSHPSQYCATLRLHLPLSEFISHLRSFKCLKSLSWRLHRLVCCRKRCAACHLSRILLVCQQSCRQQSDLRLKWKLTVSSYLPASIKNLHLYLLTSPRSHCESWLWEHTLLPKETRIPLCQIKPNSVAKIQHSAEGGRKAWISVFPHCNTKYRSVLLQCYITLWYRKSKYLKASNCIPLTDGEWAGHDG